MITAYIHQPKNAKVNLGFLALGAAFILGSIGGMKAKAITSGFDSSMFVTLVGVTFLFGMASHNGTLDLFSKKVVALVGKNTVLIPVLMFFLSAFISAIGPGHIAAGILMTTFAVYLAFEMKIDPVTTALFAKLGANAGCASPLSLTGVLAKSLTEKELTRVTSGELVDPSGTLLGQLQNYSAAHMFLSTLLSGFVFTVIIYIATKAYKVKADNPLKLKDIPKFNRNQLLTVAAIVAMVILCIGFKLDTGLTAFVAASILILLGAAISPLSTGGAIIMSSISASKETTNEENNKMFKNLFLLSVANVGINVLMSALRVFTLGGLFY